MPSSKVTDHFSEYIGFSRMFPTIKKVVVDANGKQHVFSLSIFSLQSPFDLPLNGAALQGICRANHHKLVVKFDTAINFLPDAFAPGSIFGKVPAWDIMISQVCV